MRAPYVTFQQSGLVDVIRSSLELPVPSHVYFYDRSAPPCWESDRPVRVEPAAIAERERIAAALLQALPQSVQQVIDQDEHRRWEAVHVTPLTVTVWEDHVHVRIPYWSAAELRRRGADLNLATAADVLADVAGYDFVEHGAQGLDVAVDVYSIIDEVGRVGDQHYGVLTRGLPEELWPQRDTCVAMPGVTFPVDWLAT